VNTRDGLILTIDEVATATAFAMSAMAAMKPTPTAVLLSSRAHLAVRFDFSDHFMAGNARVSESGKTTSTVRASVWQTPQASTRILTLVQSARQLVVDDSIVEPLCAQVRIRVEACGVCHTDALTVEGGFPGLTYRAFRP